MSVVQIARPTPASGLTDQGGNRADQNQWLANHQEGRLGCQTGRGWRSIPVRYVVSGSDVLVELPTFHDLVHYAPGQTVAFEVAGPLPGGLDRTVVVYGIPHLVDRCELSPQPPFERQWPKALPVKVLALPLSCTLPTGTPRMNFDSRRDEGAFHEGQDW